VTGPILLKINVITKKCFLVHWKNHEKAQRADQPPSAATTEPVIKEMSLEARKKITLAIS
jgi:hypothetical protein